MGGGWAPGGAASKLKLAQLPGLIDIGGGPDDTHTAGVGETAVETPSPMCISYFFFVIPPTKANPRRTYHQVAEGQACCCFCCPAFS